MTKPLDFSKPVQTRDGRPVRILCTDRKHPHYTVIGLIEIDGLDATLHWTEDGHYFSTRKEDCLDLFQAPQPRKHAELIKRWAEDDSMRIKCQLHIQHWNEIQFPDWDPDYEYEEILPGDPLY